MEQDEAVVFRETVWNAIIDGPPARPKAATVIVTREIVDAGKSAAGAWTRPQLALLGVPWPPPKGWRSNIEDRLKLPQATIDKFLGMRKTPLGQEPTLFSLPGIKNRSAPTARVHAMCEGCSLQKEMLLVDIARYHTSRCGRCGACMLIVRHLTGGEA